MSPGLLPSPHRYGPKGRRTELRSFGSAAICCQLGPSLLYWQQTPSPLAYWVSEAVRDSFARLPRAANLVSPREGLATGNNEKYVRLWFEASKASIGINCESRSQAKESCRRWFPYNKGGDFRKWSGNNLFIVDWLNDGSELQSTLHPSGFRIWAHNFNLEFIFRPFVTWSDVTSKGLTLRVFPCGYLFDATGLSAFSIEEGNSRMLSLMAALGNSVVGEKFSQILNPTLHFKSGNFADLPVDTSVDITNTEYCISLARADWNAYERSWDFQSLPLLTVSTDSSRNLESSYGTWITKNKDAIAVMKRLEEENNRLIIDAYGLADELIADVPIEQITLTVNPSYRYSGDGTEDEGWERFQRDSMAEFLSYATGCMMGRYSLDQPGLILADSRDSQAAQLAAYEDKVGSPLGEVQFKPDPDGIIPVLDGEWFEDDIVARTREFLEVTFPESTVTENLRFIEESLGKDIRKYFCSEFYKDHLQTYKKRPIYWQVQSPKKGFACLIYLHRYTKDTLNQVLNNYFRPYLQKLEASLAQLGLDQLNDDLSARERTAARKEAEKITKVLKECQAWEQDALLPLAQQRIDLDLDDGVKVNYLKMQDVLAPIPGLAAKED